MIGMEIAYFNLFFSFSIIASNSSTEADSYRAARLVVAGAAGFFAGAAGSAAGVVLLMERAASCG